MSRVSGSDCSAPFLRIAFGRCARLHSLLEPRGSGCLLRFKVKKGASCFLEAQLSHTRRLRFGSGALVELNSSRLWLWGALLLSLVGDCPRGRLSSDFLA